MSSLQSKLQSFEQHWHVVLICGIAAFARMAPVNVDLSGRIGPLLDSNDVYHNAKNSSVLSQYLRIFGPSNRNYMSLLGPEVQKSPKTHPMRCFDPSRLWLMRCNGGPGMRNDRKGLHLFRTEKESFVNIVLQCILV
jgi:hypothetical protein